MQRRSKVLIALAAVAVVVTGVIGIATASTDGSPGDGWQDKRAEFADAVGEKLGVSGEEVLSAVQEVRDDRLDQAVEDGEVTQKQADRIRGRLEEGGPRGHWGHGFRDSKEPAE